MSHLAELSQRRENLTPVRHNFLTLLSVVVSDRIATLRQRSMTQLFTHRKRSHTHTAVRTYVLSQRLGVPYEVERTVCSECRRLLDERPLKRAAA
jgi:RNase P subunit RPR2